MNTFLPYPDFRASARSLDTSRLNKQILEVYSILRALRSEQRGYRYHPATLMWLNHERALSSFGIACGNELYHRTGHTHRSTSEIIRLGTDIDDRPIGLPWWYGNHDFHHSHQLILHYKKPDHYGPIFGLSSPPTQRPYYIWPVSRDRWWRDHQDTHFYILKSHPRRLPSTVLLDLTTNLTSPLVVGTNVAQYLLQPKDLAQ